MKTGKQFSRFKSAANEICVFKYKTLCIYTENVCKSRLVYTFERRIGSNWGVTVMYSLPLKIEGSSCAKLEVRAKRCSAYSNLVKLDIALFMRML